MIIFQDGVATPFSPTFMRTHFNRTIRSKSVTLLPRGLGSQMRHNPVSPDIFIVVRKVVEDAQIGYQYVM